MPPSAVLSKYQGESERAVRRLFATARARTDRPTVIFFDEADSLAPSRGGCDDLQARRMLAEVLVQLSALEDPASSANDSAETELKCDNNSIVPTRGLPRHPPEDVGNGHNGEQGSDNKPNVRDKRGRGKFNSYYGRSTVSKSIPRSSKRARYTKAMEPINPVRYPHPSHRSSQNSLGDSTTTSCHLRNASETSSIRKFKDSCEHTREADSSSAHSSKCNSPADASTSSSTNNTPLPLRSPPPQQPVVVVAATNLVNDLDPAFLRRFSSRVLVASPPNEDRAMLLAHFLTGLAHSLEDGHFQCLATATDGWSGSDLKCLARHAAMQPLRRLFRSIPSGGNSNTTTNRRQSSTAATTAKAAAALSTAGSNGMLASSTVVIMPADFVDAFAALAPTISSAFKLGADDVVQSAVDTLTKALDAVSRPALANGVHSSSVGTSCSAASTAMCSSSGASVITSFPNYEPGVNSRRCSNRNIYGVQAISPTNIDSANVASSQPSSSHDPLLCTEEFTPENVQTDTTLNFEHHAAQQRQILASEELPANMYSKLPHAVDDVVSLSDLPATVNAESDSESSTATAQQEASQVVENRNALAGTALATTTSGAKPTGATKLESNVLNIGNILVDAAAEANTLGALVGDNQSPNKITRISSTTSPTRTLDSASEQVVRQNFPSQHFAMVTSSEASLSGEQETPEFEFCPLSVSKDTPPSPLKENPDLKALVESPAAKMPPPPAKPPKARNPDGLSRGISSPCLTIANAKDAPSTTSPFAGVSVTSSLAGVSVTPPAPAISNPPLPLPGQRRPWVPPKSA